MSDPSITTNTPPTFPDMTDIPNVPTSPQIIPDVQEKKEEKPEEVGIPTSVQPQTLDNDGVNLPPIIGNSSTPKKKGGKVVAAILGIFLLVSAVGAGVMLVNQNQDIREKASSDPVGCNTAPAPICTPGDSQCQRNNENGAPVHLVCKAWSEYCPNTGYWVTDADTSSCATQAPAATECNGKRKCGPNSSSLCKNQCEGYTYCSPLGGDASTPLLRTCEWEADNNDGTINCTNTIGAACAETTSSPTSTPTIPPESAQCLMVKAYDTNWNPLTQTELNTLHAGDIVRFTVSGNPAASIDRARFIVTAGSDATQSGEVTAKKPASDEYYYEYTIPEGATSFNVTAQIHHLTLGWF